VNAEDQTEWTDTRVEIMHQVQIPYSFNARKKCTLTIISDIILNSVRLPNEWYNEHNSLHEKGKNAWYPREILHL